MGFLRKLSEYLLSGVILLGLIPFAFFNWFLDWIEKVQKGGKNSKYRSIYLDYAAATPALSDISNDMETYLFDYYANSLSKHDLGRDALNVIRESKKEIAEILNVKQSEIVYTSGATESNTLAIEGLLRDLKKQGVNLSEKNIVISNLEHSSVRGVHSLTDLYGVEIREALSNEEGIVLPEKVLEWVDENTVLVSLVYINSEIGTIQPITEVSRALKHTPYKIFFHTDASQTPLWMRLDLSKLGVDLATFDASKFHGPKGVGFLYVKHGTPLSSLFFTADPEVIRPGTPPTAQITACARAFKDAQGELLEERVKEVVEERDYFISELLKFPRVSINGSLTERVANNVSVSFLGANHEFLRVLLNEKGIYASTGSACTSRDEEVRSVKALGRDNASAIRFTLGPGTTREEIDTVICALEDILKKGLI